MLGPKEQNVRPAAFVAIAFFSCHLRRLSQSCEVQHTSSTKKRVAHKRAYLRWLLLGRDSLLLLQGLLVRLPRLRKSTKVVLAL